MLKPVRENCVDMLPDRDLYATRSDEFRFGALRLRRLTVSRRDGFRLFSLSRFIVALNYEKAPSRLIGLVYVRSGTDK
jgi:hypothetical protein